MKNRGNIKEKKRKVIEKERECEEDRTKKDKRNNNQEGPNLTEEYMTREGG